MPKTALSQSEFQFGLLPSINFNKKLPRDWSINFKAESRQALAREEFEYEYLLTDLSLAVARKISVNTTVAGGYLLRITDDRILHRTIQQLSTVVNYPGFKLGHRIAADQTFDLDDATVFRFRYRASVEIPLSGQTLDPKELFVKVSNEYLNGFYKDIYDLEIRALGFLGYSLTAASKLELGLDYRINSFVNGPARHRLWLGLNFYQSL